MLVAVLPDKFTRGLNPPGFSGQTYDWRSDVPEENTRGIRPAARVLSLVEALLETHRTDAHFTTGVLERDCSPLAYQPRICKPALAWLGTQGLGVRHDVLVVDVDNPDHEPWSPEGRADLRALWDANKAPLDTCGIYTTKHGYRLIQPLDEPVVASMYERTLRTWLDELEAAGVSPDRACVDWTRLFRLPRVLRNGKRTDPYFEDYSRLEPRVIDPAPDDPKTGGDVREGHE